MRKDPEAAHAELVARLDRALEAAYAVTFTSISTAGAVLDVGGIHGLVFAKFYEGRGSDRAYPKEQLALSGAGRGGAVLVNEEGNAHFSRSLPERSWKGPEGYHSVLLIEDIFIVREVWQDDLIGTIQITRGEAENDVLDALREVARGLGFEVTLEQRSW